MINESNDLKVVAERDGQHYVSHYASHHANVSRAFTVQINFWPDVGYCLEQRVDVCWFRANSTLWLLTTCSSIADKQLNWFSQDVGSVWIWARFLIEQALSCMHQFNSPSCPLGFVKLAISVIWYRFYYPSHTYPRTPVSLRVKTLYFVLSREF